MHQSRDLQVCESTPTHNSAQESPKKARAIASRQSMISTAALLALMSTAAPASADPWPVTITPQVDAGFNFHGEHGAFGLSAGISKPFSRPHHTFEKPRLNVRANAGYRNQVFKDLAYKATLDAIFDFDQNGIKYSPGLKLNVDYKSVLFDLGLLISPYDIRTFWREAHADAYVRQENFKFGAGVWTEKHPDDQDRKTCGRLATGSAFKHGSNILFTVAGCRPTFRWKVIFPLLQDMRLGLDFSIDF